MDASGGLRWIGKGEVAEADATERGLRRGVGENYDFTLLPHVVKSVAVAFQGLVA